MRQDVCLQSAQRGPGIDPEFVGERLPGPAQRVERVALPVGAVKRQREQPPPLLTQWFLAYHRLEVGHHYGGVTTIHPSSGDQLATDRPHLLQPADLRL